MGRTDIEVDTKLMLAEIWKLTDEIVDMLAGIKGDFEAHTHNGDGAQAGSYFTSPPRVDAATVTAGTLRTVSAPPTKMTH